MWHEIRVHGGPCAGIRGAGAAEAADGAGNIARLHEADEGLGVNDVTVTDGKRTKHVRSLRPRPSWVDSWRRSSPGRSSAWAIYSQHGFQFRFTHHLAGLLGCRQLNPVQRFAPLPS